MLFYFTTDPYDLFIFEHTIDKLGNLWTQLLQI